VLERSRELASLRSLGMSRGQVGSIVTVAAESGRDFAEVARTSRGQATARPVSARSRSNPGRAHG
jgi:hypothetical protein